MGPSKYAFLFLFIVFLISHLRIRAKFNDVRRLSSHLYTFSPLPSSLSVFPISTDENDLPFLLVVLVFYAIVV